MRILGIDPGAGGAVALLEHGNLLNAWDMPAVEVKVGKKLRRRIVPAELARIVREAGASHAFLELVNSTPNDGHVQAFSFGKAAGLMEMACAAIGLPYTLVTPGEWKPALRLGSDKRAACARAAQLWPGHVWFGPRGGPLDGRAEAALLAWYGARRDGLASSSIEW